MDGEGYLAELAALKAAVSVPVIASLNGTSAGGWTYYARKLAEAGAAALELNLYDIATDPREGAAAVEARQTALVADVVQALAIPVTVKLAPSYTSLPAFVLRLRDVGAQGVTVFNRLFDPLVDLDALEVRRHLEMSMKGARQKAPSFMSFEVTSERQEAVAPFLERITALVHDTGLVLVSARPVA
jgi:dihydroorotate dehydrogenase (fumarate)